MRRRFILAVILAGLFAGIFAVPAFSLDTGPPYEWISIGGPESYDYHVLLDKEGNFVESYTKAEWENWEREINAAGDCMGYASGCAEQQVEDKTPIEGPTETGANDAQKAVEDARDEGPDMDVGTAGTLDELGFYAETLPELPDEANSLVTDGLKNPAEACEGGPEVCLEGGAFLVGLAIGNGLDQLFSLPDLEEIELESKESTVAEAEEKADKEGKGFIECTAEGVSPEYTYEHYETEPGSNSYYFGGIETTTKEYMQPGCYFLPTVPPSCGPYATQCEVIITGCECNSDNHNTAGVYYTPSTTPEPPYDPGHWTLEEHELKETVEDCPAGECYGIEGSYPEDDFTKTIRFKTWRFVSEPRTCGTQAYTYADCMKPAGVAAPGIVSPGIETNNVKAGLQPAPVYPHPAHIPTKGPEKVTEKKVKEITEVKPAREIVKTPTTEPGHEEKKKEEEEAKPLEIPIPQEDELATSYATEVEAAGFTSPAPEVFPLKEASSNPDEGPEDVGSVSPDPGSRAEPGTKVKIGENPKDEPKDEPSHSGIGGPTEPGINFPKFGVLCKGFPFGVPCWLAQTVEGWSAASKAPKWGISSFSVEGHTIPGATFDLTKLEPIMEVVRPAMLVFATIGLVLLFYRFAKGGSPASGSGSDSSSGGSSDEGEN